MTQKRVAFAYYILLIIAFSLLLFFALTLQPRGDEGAVYLLSFQQAYAKWPALDINPAWTISSFYLWLIATCKTLVNDISLLCIGRLFSLFCWSVLTVAHLNTCRYKALLVLFNPYFLVYAVRAHPLVPGILLFYLFWTFSQNKQRAGYIFLPFATNFQVFIGGIAGLYMPEIPFRKGDIIKIILISVLALSGIVITWLTWNGMYPTNFLNSDFYKQTYLEGKPSFGYLGTVLLLAGATWWVAGDRNLKDINQNKAYSWAIVVSILCIVFSLLFSGNIIGIAREASFWISPNFHHLGCLCIYGLAGLGWLRLHRDHYMVFFGLFGSAILLITLPFFYERISVFATIAPCLAWANVGNDTNQHKSVTLAWCFIFLAFSVLYQLYGSL